MPPLQFQFDSNSTAAHTTMASRAAALLASLLIFTGSTGVQCMCTNITSLSAAVDTLLAEYEREMPPATPVRVSVALEVRHASIVDATATLRIIADLRMKWEDKRLKWNASEWGCDNVLVSDERLWRPDLALMNVADYALAIMRARLDSDGRVDSTRRLHIQLPVSLYLDKWPRDQHSATVVVGSPTHTADELELSTEDTNLVLWSGGAWEVLSVTRSEGSMTVAGAEAGGEERDVAMWRVAARRVAAPQALAAAATLAACAALLLAAALLPPAARPPLAAAAAFTAAFWLLLALVRLPGGASAPTCLRVVCAVCVSGSACAVGAALVLRLARCAAPPPRALRALLTAVSALCNLVPPEDTGAESRSWAAAAKLLDYVLLTIIGLTIFISLCIYATI